MNIPTEALIPTFVAAALAFLGALHWVRRGDRKIALEKLEVEKKELTARITSLETETALLRQSVQPISVAFQAILVKELTHFHTPRMDALLVKLGPPYTLDAKEEEELTEALTERAKDMGDLIPQSEREAALMLPFVIKRIKNEVVIGLNGLDHASFPVVVVPSKN